MLTTALSLFGAPTPAPAEQDWTVKQLQFSAVTIGVSMQDELNGWSSFTNGASGVQITKTTDGGETWAPVANQTNVGLIMSTDVGTTPFGVVTSGLAGNTHSSDGNSFEKSTIFPPDLAAQSLKAYEGGRVIIAAPGGACLSTDSGANYKCVDVPFKYGKAGRYVAWPTPDVMYVTAGSWPSDTPATEHERMLSSKLRVVNRGFDGHANAGSRVALEIGPFADKPAVNGETYTAELWKSADGGATWTSLVDDSGQFYFNDIDCFDASHCVAVAEGFGHDGSAAPGAKVFMTSDGAKFNVVHSEDTDGSSLMAVKMLSASEFHVGGQLDGGMSLHSADGGQTFTKQGSEVRGQMITSMSFPTPTHGFATSISQLQVCSLLEYGAA